LKRGVIPVLALGGGEKRIERKKRKIERRSEKTRIEKEGEKAERTENERGKAKKG